MIDVHRIFSIRQNKLAFIFLRLTFTVDYAIQLRKLSRAQFHLSFISLLAVISLSE